MEDALLHKLAAKFEIGFEHLMATCRAMDNIGGRTVLRQNHRLDSLRRSSFGCSTLLCEGLRVCVKPFESGNKQIFLLLPIQVDCGARQSRFFSNIANRGSAISEIAEPSNGRYENPLSRVF